MTRPTACKTKHAGIVLATLAILLTLFVPTAWAAPATGLVPILVKFKAAASPTDIQDAIGAGGGNDIRTFKQLRTHVIMVPAAAEEHILDAFRKHEAVERANPAVQMSKAALPDDPEYPRQWGLTKIGWDQAYSSTAVSGTAEIAVLDTGIDSYHSDLSPLVTDAVSFLNGGDANTDPNGHGTAMAGIAAAAVNNATGMAGVAYSGVTLASVQVLGADGTGYDSDVVAGVLWAADHGVNVVLMAFSSPQYSSALNDALQYAWGKGVTLVAATGNDGSAAASYPAGMSNVLGVAATDQNDSLWANSNTGSAGVAAPGVGIEATLPGGGYGTVTGTSAAAAHVAGEAALLAAGGKSNDYIFNQVRSATDPVGGQSFGRINLAAAMGAEAPAPAPEPTPEPSPDRRGRGRGRSMGRRRQRAQRSHSHLLVEFGAQTSWRPARVLRMVKR